MATAGSWAICNTLEEFDDHIRKMRQQLTELEYCRNLRAPVCRLPVEIIGKIFTLTIDWDWDRKFPKVMQICRLWRAIAAKTLSMWTHLDLSRPKMAQEVLKYSGSAPLCVIMSSAYCQQNLFLEMLEQPSRISSLHMSGISPNLITNLLAKATQPVPYLRSIEIRPEGVPIRPAEFIPVILPTNFLGEDAPRLVSLHTTGCSIPWGSRAFRNLTTLHVSNSTLPTNMSLEDIAVTLQAATKLMEVDISDFFPSQTNVALSRNFAIVLPHLNRLKLSSRAIVIATLLQCMTFPTSTNVHLEISELEDALDSLCSSISGLFTDAAIDSKHMRSIESLNLIHDDGQSITLGEVKSLHHGNFTFKDPFSVQLTDHQVDAGICQRLLNALGTLPYLKKLEIYAPSLSQDALIERFGGCPLLCAITTYGLSAEVIVTSLSSNLSATHQPVPYPAVSTIILQSVDFDMIPMSTLLVDMLQRRSEYGVPVKRVVLRCCENLKADKVEMLREEVGSDVEINWDGIESPSDSDDYNGSSDA
ncbi:hypothetical protein PM082_003665 [Marasmius tenuissimus]|nr:hypothetical protein PM082_003665 [Marasmius tenuissimus]